MSRHDAALAELDAAVWGARSQAERAAAVHKFNQKLLANQSTQEVTHMSEPNTITVDRATWEQLQRDAAAAPPLIAQAKAAQAHPVRAGAAPARLAAPVGPAVPEPSEADWEGFLWSTGLPGYRRPERPLTEPWIGGALSSTPERSDADFDAFTASIGLGRK